MHIAHTISSLRALDPPNSKAITDPRISQDNTTADAEFISGAVPDSANFTCSKESFLLGAFSHVKQRCIGILDRMLFKKLITSWVMVGLGFFVALYFIILMFIVYVMICGNNKFHRNGCIGWIYRTSTRSIKSCSERICPAPVDPESDESCTGPKGCCRYGVAIFYAGIYINFVFWYVHRVHPRLPFLFPESYRFHAFLTFFVIPWPWVIVIALHQLDPGSITKNNVESYLKAYPYDNVLYTRTICETLKIPVPARSRFCKFTRRRIAYICFALTHRRYDHYCPWVMAPIGARTHRFFICFLIFNALAITYYFCNQTRYCIRYYRLVERKLSEYSAEFQDWKILIFVFVKQDPMIVGTTFLAFVVALTLWFFILQQFWYISKNLTQIELEKIDTLREKWKEEKVTQKYVHVYNRGFVQNWKEFLFPPVILAHEPLDYSAEIAECERKKRQSKEREKAQKSKLD